MAVDPTANALEHDEIWYSWGDLARGIETIDALLTQAGVGKDGRVGVLIRNRPGHLAAILAVLATERCLVTLNPLLPKDKLLRDIAGLDLPVLLGEPADLDVPEIAGAIAAAGSAVIAVPANLGAIQFAAGREKPTGGSIRATEPGVAVEMLTSGTTGTPKRIPLTRRSFDKSFSGALFYERDRVPGEAAKLRPDTVLLNAPLTHIGGVYTALTALIAGRKGCLQEKFRVTDWHKAIVRHRPRVTAVVPTGLRMILEADIPPEDLSSLKAIRTGTAPLDPEIADEFLRRYDLPILQTYGATEFAGSIAGWTLRDFRTLWAQKRGSAGRLHADVDARAINPETGEILPLGQEGVLELRAPQMGNDEWHRTTDRVTIDEDGFLFVHGRSDNAINRGGFKIHPDDVVAALEKHAAVREAVVVGIPDKRLGEVPVAAIMLRAGAQQPSAEEMTAHAKANLLPYQVPVAFRFVDDVPRTPSLKPSLPELRKMFSEVVTA
nr:fatty acid--CoA ligase family protein [Novosphingobium hassiacum]